MSIENKNIKLLVLDVDGVLTDGGVYVSAKGEAFKKFNSKDGMGIMLCHLQGIIPAILSAGRSPQIVQQRADMLHIKKVYVGQKPKLDVLKSWLEDLDITPEEVAYIGDDIPDIPCLEYVGLSACPADGANQVKPIVDIILTKNGGDGCVRELVEMIL